MSSLRIKTSKAEDEGLMTGERESNARTMIRFSFDAVLNAGSI